MMTFLINTDQKKEGILLKKTVDDVFAFASDDDLDCEVFYQLSQLLREISQGRPADILCVDIIQKDGLSAVKSIRRALPGVFLMAIADDSLSPLDYISPDIMLSSLLFRPVSGEQVTRVIEKAIRSFLDKWNTQNGDDSQFVFESKNGKQLIPYSSISCFEARNKKVYAVCENNEYSFYGTIDALEEQLPTYFIRCHRGFIVNKNKISRVLKSQNILILLNDEEIPLSRSYKERF